MKVLVVSHNVFSKTSNMGKTMSTYFSAFGRENVAQFYIHSEVPTDDYVCNNFYRVTDLEIIKSIFTRKSGNVLGKDDIDKNRLDSRTDTGALASVYQKSQKRTPLIFMARNFLWKLGRWDTKKLRSWIDKFSPDAVFFASGDYSFMYKIALKIAKRKNIPLYVSCMDDFYFYNKNEDMFLGKLEHKLFMKNVFKCMEYSSGIFPICEKMSDEYSKLFNKPCYTLHTGSDIEEPLKGKRGNKISYLGNLDFERHKQLIDLGKALLKIESDKKPEYIDVYSAETRPEILEVLTKENGINFCGKISAEEVKKVISESALIIHTESFEEKIMQTVAYSVSTKIADSLASGTCLLAYGPKGIASMDYLIQNDVAFCITSKEQAEDKLKQIIEDEKLREEIISRQLKLAEKNHRTSVSAGVVKEVLER